MKFGRVGLCVSACGETDEVVLCRCWEWMFGVFVVVEVIQVVVDSVFGSQTVEQSCPLRSYRRCVRDADEEKKVLKVMASDSE